MSRARLMPTTFLSLVLAPFLSKLNNSFIFTFKRRLRTTTTTSESSALFPLSKTTPLHSFQHRLHQYPRPTSLEPDREGWVVVDVLFVLGRGAPIVSYIFHFSDRFYYILVRVVVTGSYVARHRHPDPRIPHCSYNLLSCALSMLRSIICQTALP
jgi:hypothetical protein